MTIPKIIHQFWDGPLERPVEYMNEVRDRYEEAGWQYKLWNLESATKDLGAVFNQHTLNYCKEWCGKSDIIRYELLRKHGGVYVDCDCKFVKLISDDMLQQDFFCGLCREDYPNNNVLGSMPNGSLINNIIHHIHENQMDWFKPKHQKPAHITIGPMAVHQMTKQYTGDSSFTIYPKSYFNPVYYKDNIDHTDENTCFDHQWIGTKISLRIFK